VKTHFPAARKWSGADIAVVLGNAWIIDRESRDLPGGNIVAKRGPSASLVSLSLDDAIEMLSDLDLYGGPDAPEFTPPDVRRCAVAALPRLRAAVSRTAPTETAA
jgi:hypothetical protein